MRKKKNAQTMLLAILIITSAALAIGLAVVTISSTELKILLQAKNATGAGFTAESCLENALLKMSRTNVATLSNFTLGEASCRIEISGSNPYVVKSTAEQGQTIREIEATLSITKEALQIESVGEVSN